MLFSYHGARYITHFFCLVVYPVFCKQTVELRSAASDLGLHCLHVCHTKRSLGVYGLSINAISFVSPCTGTNIMYFIMIFLKPQKRSNMYS